MKQILASTIFAALMMSGAHAFGDDAMKSDHMTTEQKQMMKDCMAKQKSMHSDMSKEDMKSACMTEMRQKMDKDSMPQKQQ